MVMRESVIWRWSHNRHHSDTIIVGRDPEIAVPRSPDVKASVMNFFGLRVYVSYFRAVAIHCLSRMSAAEKTFVPASEFPRIYRNARIYIASHVLKAGFAAEITANADGWVAVCAAADLPRADVVRLDCARKTYAICRDEEGRCTRWTICARTAIPTLLTAWSKTA